MLPQLGGHTRTQYEKARQAAHDVDGIFKVTIVPLLDIANSALVDAVWEIKKRGLYKHDIKRWCKEAQQAFERFERQLYDGMQPYIEESMRDFLDCRQESLRPLIKSLNPLKLDRNKPIPLFEAIKAAMANQGEDDIVFKATMELVNALNDAVIITHRMFVESVRRMHRIDISRAVTAADGRAQKCAFERVSSRLCKYSHGYSFYEDKFVKRALDAIVERALSLDDAEVDVIRATDGNEEAKAHMVKNEYYIALANELTEAKESGLVADIVIPAKVYDAADNDMNITITPHQYELLIKKPYRFARIRRGVSGDRVLFRIGRARKKNGVCKLKLEEKIVVN